MVDELEELDQRLEVVGDGVYSYDSVTGAEDKSIDDGSGDADWIISGVVRL
jgi:hypothetical protein